MPIRDRVCPTCGWVKADNYESRTTMDVFCPNGHATEIVYVGASAAIHGDDPFVAGKVFENLGHAPVTIYSRSQLKREMQARGLQEFVRHQPLAGSDKSPHTTSWSSMSAVTLESAAALVKRVSG